MDTEELFVDSLFVCSLCLFNPKPESPENDDRLTIINGEMVCVDHQRYVPRKISIASLMRGN